VGAGAAAIVHRQELLTAVARDRDQALGRAVPAWCFEEVLF
jgi:hypothetical protein